jgi:hypothetical protein
MGPPTSASDEDIRDRTSKLDALVQSDSERQLYR